MMEWNGQPIQHMSTSHIINTMAWLWRIMMHKRFGLMATKYAEVGRGLDVRTVQDWGEDFMDNFSESNAQQTIDAMYKELMRRKRSAR